MTFLQLRICLIVGLLLGLNQALAQPICQPDSTLDSLGVFPSTPPPGTVGQPYELNLNAAIPKSIDAELGGDTLNFSICEARITGTDTSLADIGLTYECNFTDCQITIDHTDTTSFAFACIVVEGTPTAPIDSIDVLLQADVGSVNGGQCVTIFTLDTSLSVGLVIAAHTGLFGSLTDAGMNHFYHADQERLATQLNLAQAGRYQLEVLDLSGRVIAAQPERALIEGQHTMDFETAEWPSGLYLLRLRRGDGVLTQKVLLRR